jgi:Uma2 family endonuclease
VVEPARQRFDFGEYLRLEEISTVRHEFLGGMVWAMAGGSPEHARVTANVARLLGIQLAGQRCSVYSSDLRVRVATTGLGTYPDVTVVCDQLELDPADPKGHTVLNPKMIVEVLSPSTEEYDRGEKLDHYKRIPSLQSVALVAYDAQHIDVWSRDDQGGWSVAAFGNSATATVGLGCNLDLAEVYRDPLRL